MPSGDCAWDTRRTDVHLADGRNLIAAARGWTVKAFTAMLFMPPLLLTFRAMAETERAAADTKLAAL